MQFEETNIFRYVESRNIPVNKKMEILDKLYAFFMETPEMHRRRMINWGASNLDSFVNWSNTPEGGSYWREAHQICSNGG